MYVLMVVPSNFPNGDAGAVRDMAFAKIYQRLGYEVILIGAGREEKEGIYQGVHYYSLYWEAKSLKDHILNYVVNQFHVIFCCRYILNNMIL